MQRMFGGHWILTKSNPAISFGSIMMKQPNSLVRSIGLKNGFMRREGIEMILQDALYYIILLALIFFIIYSVLYQLGLSERLIKWMDRQLVKRGVDLNAKQTRETSQKDSCAGAAEHPGRTDEKG